MVTSNFSIVLVLLIFSILALVASVNSNHVEPNSINSALTEFEETWQQLINEGREHVANTEKRSQKNFSKLSKSSKSLVDGPWIPVNNEKVPEVALDVTVQTNDDKMNNVGTTKSSSYVDSFNFDKAAPIIAGNGYEKVDPSRVIPFSALQKYMSESIALKNKEKSVVNDSSNKITPVGSKTSDVAIAPEKIIPLSEINLLDVSDNVLSSGSSILSGLHDLSHLTSSGELMDEGLSTVVTNAQSNTEVSSTTTNFVATATSSGSMVGTIIAFASTDNHLQVQLQDGNGNSFEVHAVTDVLSVSKCRDETFTSINDGLTPGFIASPDAPRCAFVKPLRKVSVLKRVEVGVESFIIDGLCETSDVTDELNGKSTSNSTPDDLKYKMVVNC